ncbi:Anaphase promoting complex, Cdc20, Cdh1, and Ama1 subunits [Phaffia rhodozyma]|uniref:Anaphase promoting complex, Cdc20, Cdh1, and Ama1 subunits n=1 Tax=Phaffia rhodozyma TaxID=264483 RepID=A0A0F7SJE5_PHARH|nr:Anaphase promoting complex, Cdc20, Cdh1, and Ama1 subunits [Phaffia rhodozyma]
MERQKKERIQTPSGSRDQPEKVSFGVNLVDRFANVSIASTDAGGQTIGGGKGFTSGDTSNVFLARPKGSSNDASAPSSRSSSRNSDKDGTLSISQAMGGMNVKDVEWTGHSASDNSGNSMDGIRKKAGPVAKPGDRFIPQRSLTSSSGTSAPALPAGPSSADTTPNGAHSSSNNTLTISSALQTDLVDHSSASSSSASLTSLSQAPTSRILAFAQPAPLASTSHDLTHAQLRKYTKFPSASAAASAGAKVDAKERKRAIPTRPERVLDAPGMVDDYYLNLMAWSSDNMVGIGLGEGVYVWNAESGGVSQLGEPTEESPQICSLTWAGDGSYLSVGNDKGDVEVWDVETGVKLRTMAGHASRVPVLSWHGHLLSSGCRDGSIHHHDVRVARHKVGELLGHTAEVCGLSWRFDGQVLASGGNDNVVNCWDARTAGAMMSNDSGSGEPATRAMARWTKRNHTAAVKALAWCPWQPSLLATGGGTGDQTIHFWSSTTGSRISSLPTASQVTSLIFSPHSKEILSTHGFPDNNICLWSYPSLQKIWEVPAHDTRVLASALSPDGSTVGTAASDENLKFWKIWEPRPVGKGKPGGGFDDESEMAGGGGHLSKSGRTGGIKIR